MISIAIPVYNEASIVREAALDLCRKLDGLGWDYELILTENDLLHFPQACFWRPPEPDIRAARKKDSNETISLLSQISEPCNTSVRLLMRSQMPHLPAQSEGILDFRMIPGDRIPHSLSAVRPRR